MPISSSPAVQYKKDDLIYIGNIRLLYAGTQITSTTYVDIYYQFPFSDMNLPTAPTGTTRVFKLAVTAICTVADDTWSFQLYNNSDTQAVTNSEITYKMPTSTRAVTKESGEITLAANKLYVIQGKVSANAAQISDQRINIYAKVD